MERKEGKVIVDRIVKGEYGTAALLKQEHVTIYPGARGSNSMQSGLFNDNEFGKDRIFTNLRYALVKVPDNATEQEISKRLEQFSNARIYRVLSNNVEDVLTSEQKIMMQQGRSTMTIESYKDKYAVRNKDGEAIPDAHGNMQFGRNFFTHVIKADMDMRQPVTVGSITGEIPAEEAVETPEPAIAEHIKHGERIPV